jgi:hypothetical protein
MRPEYTPEFVERFWSKVDRSGGPPACWPFAGCIVNGYGQVSVAGKLDYAHRVALELSGVSLEGGLDSLHTCDNRPCCNPSHLYAGTDIDNVRDRSERGGPYKPHDPATYRRGFGNHPIARFRDDEVRTIRNANRAGVSTVDLARGYGASQSTIWSLVRGKAYRHVE